MQITNGTVSRTVKPADYEGRTVTLSFTADPGDDIELALSQLSLLCEKHARQLPPLQATDVAPVALVPAAAPVETAKPRGRTAAPKPPVVESVARIEPEPAAAVSVAPAGVAPVPPITAPSSPVVAPAGIASSTAPASSTATAAQPTETASAADRDITTDDLNRAIGLARKIWQVPGERVEQVRNAATGVAGMSIFAPEATQEMKRAFLAGIEALNPNAPGEKY